MAEPLELRRGAADEFVARAKPGGAEQDITGDLITVDFAKDAKSTKVLTLTSADSNEVELISGISQTSTAVTTLTANTNGGYIEAAGATFVDNGVLKGEEVVVTGDGAGTYTVKKVLKNTKLQVEEPLADFPTPTSTVVVNRGDGWFLVKLDVADVALLTFSKGSAFLYRTVTGEEKKFIGEICIHMKDAPA